MAKPSIYRLLLIIIGPTAQLYSSSLYTYTCLPTVTKWLLSRQQQELNVQKGQQFLCQLLSRKLYL